MSNKMRTRAVNRAMQFPRMIARESGSPKVIVMMGRHREFRRSSTISVIILAHFVPRNSQNHAWEIIRATSHIMREVPATKRPSVHRASMSHREVGM
jgi:hypothetical protein